MNLDRFAVGPQDPAEAKVMATCAACGSEIYEGECVYVTNGDILCANWGCLHDYIDPKVMTVEEALGVA
jgi:hypothetical protein